MSCEFNVYNLAVSGKGVSEEGHEVVMTTFNQKIHACIQQIKEIVVCSRFRINVFLKNK